MTKNGNTRQRHRAISLIWIAVSAAALVGFLGLAMDVGFALLAGQQLQNAADAASLAGAARVRGEANLARDQAVAIALANMVTRRPVQLDRNEDNGPGGDIVIGRFDREERVFAPGGNAPNAVRVHARRTADSANGPVPLLFGRAFGVESVELRRMATAMIGGDTEAGLIALCPDCKCSLDVRGTATLQTGEGSIQVNSAVRCGACAVGSATIDAPELNIVGPGDGADAACFNDDHFTGEVNDGVSPVPDPLGYLPAPSIGARGQVATTDEWLRYTPGYHPSGIVATREKKHFLEPGVYILDGPGLNIGANATFEAYGVLLYVRGPGVVDIDGSGIVTITPPDPDQHFYAEAVTYEGVSIFQARADDGECGASRIVGTSMLDLQGTLYFPCAPLELRGTGDGFGNQLIAYTIQVRGEGVIDIQYDGRFPAPGNKVFLVE